MAPTFTIAWRFLKSRKQSMLIGLCGIIFGIGFFIITQAQTSGFEKFFIQTILGTDGSIRIQDRIQNTLESTLSRSKKGHITNNQVRNTSGKNYIEGVEFPQQTMDALSAYDQVSGISEILRGRATVSSGFRTQPARLYGIDIKDHLNVSDLGQQIQFGDIQAYTLDPNSVIIGSKLASRLNTQIGDYISIKTVAAQERYRVNPIFQTGVNLIDKQRIYINIDQARSLMHKPSGGSLLQIELKNPDIAPQIATQMENTINHSAISWQERERAWLDVFNALRISSAITVSTIILLSGLGMFNTLAMMVMEKTREIAILRSMGYQRSDISKIFLWQGAMILTTGTLIGWTFGALATYGISKIPLRIRGIFTTDHIIVNWDIYHYITAAAIAAVVVLFASYIPAKRAAKLEPGSIIRGASS